MSVATDLAEMFAEQELTHPARFNGVEARGFYDEEGTLRQVLGTHVQAMDKVLYVRDGVWPTLARDGIITLGSLGAESAVGGTDYIIGDFRPIDDGLIIAIPISGAGK